MKKCRKAMVRRFLSTALYLTSPLLTLPAASPVHPSVADPVALTGKSVERFWQQITSVTCTETVTQEKIGKSGKVEYRQQSIFDYLMFMSFQGDDLAVEESRLLQKSIGKSKNLPLAITSGFPTLPLVFHPYYEGSYRVQPDGEETLNGKRLLLIHYEHIPGTRSTSALRLRDRYYPLDLQGTAWVDPDTGSIRKMTASLEEPLEDLNLRAFEVEVVYEPQQFSSSSDSEWLPGTATIRIQTARQQWRNVHRFSNYRRFSVDATSKVSK